MKNEMTTAAPQDIETATHWMDRPLMGEAVLTTRMVWAQGCSCGALPGACCRTQTSYDAKTHARRILAAKRALAAA